MVLLYMRSERILPGKAAKSNERSLMKHSFQTVNPCGSNSQAYPESFSVFYH